MDEKSKIDSIPITIYNFDPTLAPEGKTCMRVILHTTNYQYWNNLRNNDIDKYNSEKERISKEVIRILDKHFGNIESNVEISDVATPATFKRYTNNWEGSTQGWVWGPKLIPEFISKELPNLKNESYFSREIPPGPDGFADRTARIARPIISDEKDIYIFKSYRILGDIKMDKIKIQKFKPIKLAYIEHIGKYDEVPYDRYVPRLYEWAKEKKVRPANLKNPI